MIDWERYGFREDSDPDYKGVYHREGLGFAIWEQKGFLYLCVNEEYTISKDRIPATNASIELLLKAFHVF